MYHKLIYFSNYRLQIIDIFNSYKLIRMRGTQRLSVVKKQIIIALFSIKIGSGYVRTAFRFLYPYVGKHLLPFYLQSFCQSSFLTEMRHFWRILIGAKYFKIV